MFVCVVHAYDVRVCCACKCVWYGCAGNTQGPTSGHVVGTYPNHWLKKTNITYLLFLAFLLGI